MPSKIITSFFTIKEIFRKTTRPSLPLRKAPPFSPSLSSLRDERREPPSGARNRLAIRLSDQSGLRHVVRAGTALLKADRIIEVLVL